MSKIITALAGYLFLVGLLLSPANPARAQHLSESSFDFGPATFNTAAPAEPTRGPDKAKGLVIWNHGRGDRAAAYEAPPLAWLFNQNGWDVYSMYRGWGVDARNTAVQLVMTAVERSRAMGYKRIVLMGQSAGAYASVESIAYIDGIEAVVALAPAAHGDSGKSSSWRSNDFMMRGMWEKFGREKTKAVAAYFSGDIYYESEVPNLRGPWLRKRLTELGVPNMVISEPPFGNLNGHGAGQSWNFSRRYGHCILQFVETGRAPPCDEEPAAVNTFGIARPDGFDRRDGDPLAGLWFGTWSHGRFTLLALGNEANGQKSLYRSGIGDGINKPENIGFTLKRQGDSASWQLGRYIYTARVATNGALEVSRHDPAKPADKATALLKRLD
jgi:hypothetical protein